MGQESTSLPRLTSFSTRNAPRGDEVDYWRQVRREAYVSVRTDPVGAGFGGSAGAAGAAGAGAAGAGAEATAGAGCGAGASAAGA